MKLSFETKFYNQPNYFIEKIWRGLLIGSQDFERSYQNYQRRHLEKFGVCWDGVDFGEFLEPKLHTIRKDLDHEWSPGKVIQLVINLNAAEEFHFAPQLNCVAVQRIHIDYSGLIKENGPAVFLDYELLDQETLARLAVNDGFPTIADFFLYFHQEFTGNLIHWTPVKY